MNENEKKAASKTASFLTGLLEGWGVPAAWAKALTGAVVGAIIGILVATGVLSSCTTVTKQTNTDGSSTERAFSLDPDVAKRALELWGNPIGPVLRTK